MRWRRTMEVLVACTLAGVWGIPCAYSAPPEAENRKQPELRSIFPLGGQRGAAVAAVIRGKGLDGVYALWFEGNGLQGLLRKIESVDLAARTEGEEPAKAETGQ